MKKVSISIVLIFILITVNTTNFKDRTDQSTIHLTELKMEDVYKYIGFSSEQIIAIMGTDFEEVKVGVNLMYRGYSYDALGLIFAFTDDSETVIEIYLDEKNKIQGTHVGMTLDQVREVMDGQQALVFQFNPAETWLIYSFDNYNVRYRAFDAQSPKVIELCVSERKPIGNLGLEPETASSSKMDTIKELDIDRIDSEIGLLSIEISKVKDENDILKVLRDFMDESGLEIMTVYYGDKQGGFWLVPEMEFSEDYVFIDRPPYTIAVEEGKYKPEPYKELINNRTIQSISIPVVVEKEIYGVVGMDVYID